MYYEGCPINKINYTNFYNSTGRECVAMRYLDGKWRSLGCGGTWSGSICEVKPELFPQKPDVSISGVRLTGAEMRVQNQQRLAVTCMAKIGPKGFLNFVKKRNAQAFVIDELSHVGVKRTQSTQIIDGSCYIISRAVMAFHILKDMEDHTIGCVSDNVSSLRCTQWDPYCTFLPGKFKVKVTTPQRGYINTFPVGKINIPQVPPIVLTNDELNFQSLPAQFRGGGGGGGSGTRNTMISTRGPPIGGGGGGSGPRIPNRPFVNATREPPTDRKSLRLFLFLGPPVFLLAVATAVCCSKWGKRGQQLGEEASIMNPDMFYIVNEEEASNASTMGRSSRSTLKSSSRRSTLKSSSRRSTLKSSSRRSTLKSSSRRSTMKSSFRSSGERK